VNLLWPNVSFHAGITLCPGDNVFDPRPFTIVCVIASAVPPYSQILSDRFGDPSVWLPLPSAPWQAAHAPNLSLPRTARTESCAEPESDST
jgi:hypothetical protein